MKTKTKVIIGCVAVFLIAGTIYGIATGQLNDKPEPTPPPVSTPATTPPEPQGTDNADASEPTADNAVVEIDGYSMQYGTILDVNKAGGADGKTLVIKAKIEPSFSNKSTVEQNYYNIENMVKSQGADSYETIDYWAVADMEDGTESKVVSFTVPKETIDKIVNGDVVANKIGDYVDDLYVLPSLKDK